MMDSPGSVTQLIPKLHDADPDVRAAAARLVWQRYCLKLLALARSHLNQRIRRREDEQDVLQSMFQSFCRRRRRGDFDLNGRDDLWDLLVTIALRKARNAARRHLCQRRDVRREQEALAPTLGGDPEALPRALEQMETAGPTPAEAALLNEALERRLQRRRFSWETGYKTGGPVCITFLTLSNGRRGQVGYGGPAMPRT